MTQSPWQDDEETGSGSPDPSSRPAPQAAEPPRPRRSLRSTLALSAAIVLLVMGLFAAFVGLTSLSGPQRPELGATYAMTSLVTSAALVVVGILNVASSIAILLRRNFGRRLGVVLAALGLLIAAVFLLGPLSTFHVGLSDPLMLATVASVVAYGFTLFSLIVSGSHFSPSNAGR